MKMNLDATHVAVTPMNDLERDTSCVPDNKKLEESVCEDCEARAFPPRTVCISCMGRNLVPAPLPENGTLYAASKVHISSARGTPYILGYIDLYDGVRLLAEIRGVDTIQPGTRVTLCVDEDQWYFTPKNGA